jgi:hypothetical protein
MVRTFTEFWNLLPAYTINAAMDTLPKASCEEFTTPSQPAENRFRAIVVQGEVIACPTKTYKLVQHKEALRPIIEGLTLANVTDYRYSIYSDKKKANMNIYVGSMTDATTEQQGILFGFRVINSLDGKSSIRYGFSSTKIERYFEIVGYRLACKNGMIVRVPLAEAEFVRQEERVRLQELIKLQRNIRHSGDVDKKMAEIQYITEAIGILTEPLKRMVAAARNITYTDMAFVDAIIKKYIGKRMKERIMSRFLQEDSPTLWNLYNAITYEASHSPLTYTTRMGLLERSGTLLTEQLIAVQH